MHRDTTGSANNPYRYSGYIFDEKSGLYYLKTRFYDPELARFMQEDTVRGSAADPLSLNLYTYCHNNPIRYWDPTGHAVGDIHMPDGSIVKGNIVNGQTFLPDGSRLSTIGAVVETNGGLYQMTSSGGKKVDAVVTTPNGTVTTGQIENGKTYVNGSRVSNGSVVTIGDGSSYMMINGSGQKVTPTTVYVPFENSARYTQEAGYINQHGVTYMLGGKKPKNGSVKIHPEDNMRW